MNITNINSNQDFGLKVKINKDYVFGNRKVSNVLKNAKKRIEHNYINSDFQFTLFNFKDEKNTVFIVTKKENRTLKQKFLSLFKNFYNPNKDGFAYVEDLTSNSISDAANDAVKSYNHKNYLI